VIKGIDEKVRQGWLPGLAPYGYMNVPGDREHPILPHPRNADGVRMIFDLYSRGDMTFEMLADRLAAGGHVFRPSVPRFTRSALSYILNNRVYLGVVVWRGRTYPGKHEPLIGRELFEKCQDVLHGRNRRTGSPDIVLSGGLFRCAHCGQSITGEKVKKRLADGSVNFHTYYRCANNRPGPEHPRVRWREADLERAIAEELGKMRIESDGIRDLVRSAMAKAFADIGERKRRQIALLAKRKTEIKTMQDRLLTAFLNGTIDEPTFAAKSEDLKREAEQVERNLEQADRMDPSRGQAALAVFDWCQNAAQTWLGSNKEVRREILDLVCLNRRVSSASLCLEMRRPFRELAERPFSKESRSPTPGIEQIIVRFIESWAVTGS